MLSAENINTSKVLIYLGHPNPEVMYSCGESMDSIVKWGLNHNSVIYLYYKLDQVIKFLQACFQKSGFFVKQCLKD